jgi:AraC family transcriptional regulator
MNISILSPELTGVVPAVCDFEAGDRRCSDLAVSQPNLSTGSGSSTSSTSETRQGLSTPKIRSVIAELCSAIKCALDGERCTAEESLRRAAEILQEMDETVAASSGQARGGLAPWQIRKVTSHIEAHLDRSIRNEDLAALVRLNASHFGRAFRNSFGEPPHEYVIRRRVERAQGLMLSTDAPLSAIALDCGLADQSHLTRLFRRVAGESPRAWRRARLGAPVECA